MSLQPANWRPHFAHEQTRTKQQQTVPAMSVAHAAAAPPAAPAPPPPATCTCARQQHTFGSAPTTELLKSASLSARSPASAPACANEGARDIGATAADTATSTAATAAVVASAAVPPVLFLDVDGVLNTALEIAPQGSAPVTSGRSRSAASRATPARFSVVHGSLLQRLATVVRTTNARVVLSSTWRLDARSRDRLRRLWSIEFAMLSQQFALPSPSLSPPSTSPSSSFSLVYPFDATPVISVAELLCQDGGDSAVQREVGTASMALGPPAAAAAAAEPRIGPTAPLDAAPAQPAAVQRMHEILRWIQQNQALCATSDDGGRKGTDSRRGTDCSRRHCLCSSGSEHSRIGDQREDDGDVVSSAMAHSTDPGDITRCSTCNSSNGSQPKSAASTTAMRSGAWVALDDLDLLGAAPAALQHAHRHFVRTDPRRGLSAANADQLVELLSCWEPRTGDSNDTEVEGDGYNHGGGFSDGGDSEFNESSPDAFVPRRSAAARALQQRAELLFIVDAAGPASASASTTESSNDGGSAVVIVLDASSFQSIATLRSLSEARDWVVTNDGVVLFDDSHITLVDIVGGPINHTDEPEPDTPDIPDTPEGSQTGCRDACVDLPGVWLRKSHSRVAWARGEIWDRHFSSNEKSSTVPSGSLAFTIATRLCKEASPVSTSSSAPSSTASLSSSPSLPSRGLLLELLSSLDALELQQFEASSARLQFSQCGFSANELAILSKDCLTALNVLRLVSLINPSARRVAPADEQDRRRCRLLLAICQQFPLATHAVLRQYLGEYVVRDELTSMATLEAIAFAVKHSDGDDDSGMVLLSQLDEFMY